MFQAIGNAFPKGVAVDCGLASGINLDGFNDRFYDFVEILMNNVRLFLHKNSPLFIFDNIIQHFFDKVKGMAIKIIGFFSLKFANLFYSFDKYEKVW